MRAILSYLEHTRSKTDLAVETMGQVARRVAAATDANGQVVAVDGHPTGDD